MLLKRCHKFVRRKSKLLFRHFMKISPVYIPVFEGSLLEGRVAFITGGTSGIGFAIAETFLKNGAKVVITGRNEVRINNACSELEGKGFGNRIFGVEMDSRQVSNFDACIEKAMQLCGGMIDILVNNAGVGKGCFGNCSEDDFDSVLDTNLKGAYFLSQSFVLYWKKLNIQGNILNVASSSSLRPAATPYTLSKWGVRGLTLGLAKTLIPYGIVVNGIAPGPTATPMLTDDINDLSLASSPAGRYATAQEIANLATVLVSGMGKMVIGDVLYATGGAGLITFDDINYGF